MTEEARAPFGESQVRWRKRSPSSGSPCLKRGPPLPVPSRTLTGHLQLHFQRLSLALQRDGLECVAAGVGEVQLLHQQRAVGEAHLPACVRGACDPVPRRQLAEQPIGLGGRPAVPGIDQQILGVALYGQCHVLALHRPGRHRHDCHGDRSRWGESEGAGSAAPSRGRASPAHPRPAHICLPQLALPMQVGGRETEEGGDLCGMEVDFVSQQCLPARELSSPVRLRNPSGGCLFPH